MAPASQPINSYSSSSGTGGRDHQASGARATHAPLQARSSPKFIYYFWATRISVCQGSITANDSLHVESIRASSPGWGKHKRVPMVRHYDRDVNLYMHANAPGHPALTRLQQRRDGQS
jgi:hypothetical protein